MHRSFDCDYWLSDTVVAMTPSEKYVYSFLITTPWTRLTGVFRASMPFITLALGYTAEAVEATLSRLEDAGLIFRDPETGEVLVLNFHKYNWSSSPDVLKSLVKVSGEIRSEKIKALVSDRIAKRFGDDYVEKASKKKRPENAAEGDAVKEKKTKKADAEYDPGFLTWWDAYPRYRRAAKPACYKKYMKAIAGGTTHEQMLAALESMKKRPDWQKEDGAYTPAPLTYLNQERWKDVDVKEEKPRQTEEDARRAAEEKAAEDQAAKDYWDSL